jgi:ppGpp synthetase/RelA/SpoT-type nucleotidyltranferase
MRLSTEIKDFTQNLQEIKTTIENFKNNFSPKSHIEYNNQIESLKNQLKEMEAQSKEINRKQEDLEYNPESFPLLATCKEQIKPYEEFW